MDPYCPRQMILIDDISGLVFIWKRCARHFIVTGPCFAAVISCTYQNVMANVKSSYYHLLKRQSLFRFKSCLVFSTRSPTYKDMVKNRRGLIYKMSARSPLKVKWCVANLMAHKICYIYITPMSNIYFCKYFHAYDFDNFNPIHAELIQNRQCFIIIFVNIQ